MRPLTIGRRSFHIPKTKSQEEHYEENELGTEKRNIPLEQRAHFYTGASPVCALCEANRGCIKTAQKQNTAEEAAKAVALAVFLW